MTQPCFHLRSFFFHCLTRSFDAPSEKKHNVLPFGTGSMPGKGKCSFYSKSALNETVKFFPGNHTPVLLFSFLPSALASSHLFAYSNNGHEYGAESVYRNRSRSRSSGAHQSRTDTASTHLTGSKYGGGVDFFHVQTKRITGCVFPAALLSL